MPTDLRERDRSSGRFGAHSLRLTLLVSVAFLVGACSFLGPQPVILSTVGVARPLPQPTCGGLKVLIEGGLPCEQLVSSAFGTLTEQAPGYMARGVTQIDVTLAACPSGTAPANIDCLGNDFAQYVKVTFGPAQPNGPVEPWLAVILDPVSGQVLGFESPPIR